MFKIRLLIKRNNDKESEGIQGFCASLTNLLVQNTFFVSFSINIVTDVRKRKEINTAQEPTRSEWKKVRTSL